MKANEIQIGDWVQDIIPVVIDAISNEDICTYRSEYGYITANPSNLKPIPLTAEILEKNGFTHRNSDKVINKQSWTFADGDCTIHAQYNFGVLYFDIYGKPLRMDMFRPHITMHIQYVHQLQKALRLCGIEKTIEIWKR